MTPYFVMRTPYRCAVGLMIKTGEVSEQVYRLQDDGRQAVGSVIRDIACIAPNQLPTIVHPSEAPGHFLAVAVMWDGSNGSPVPPSSNEGFTHSLGGRRLAYVYSCHRVSGRRWNVDIAGPLLGGRGRPPGRLWCQAEPLTTSKNHTKVREPCDA
jgi:hypothetical protein